MAGTEDDRDAPEVSESLFGLVGALDKLKDTMGVGIEHAAELAQVEQYINELTAENEQLQRYAEDAILQAQRLRAENDELVTELNQAKLVDMVAQTEQLTQVSYEYDKDLVDARVAEAVAVVAEVEELRERVAELEEENAGLSQTLNEFRQNQQQLQQLQMLDYGELAAVSAAAGAVDSSSSHGAEPPPPPLDVSHSSSSPFRTPESTPQRTPQALPGPVPSSAGVPSDLPSSFRTPGSGNAYGDSLAVADALAAVAGRAEAGLAVVAARMLRSHAATEKALKVERDEAQRLRNEVAELTETMTGKTFKAPSAWAEREAKYKQDKRRWEEAQKEADAALAALRHELDTLRGATGAVALERRIEELEARLLESERDCSALRSAMHELQLSSRPQAGEFSGSGVKPYSRGRLGGEGEVQQAVEQIESSGGTPPRPSYPPASPSVASSEMVQRLATVQRENQQLRGQLEQMYNSKGTVLETPEVVRQAMDINTSAKARGLREQLIRADGEKAAILAELQSLAAGTDGMGTTDAPPAAITLQACLDEAGLQQDIIRTEMALLQRGIDPYTAHVLAELEGRRQKAARREQAVAAHLAAAEQLPGRGIEDAEPPSEDANGNGTAAGQPLQPALVLSDDEASSLRGRLLQYQQEQDVRRVEMQAAVAAAALRPAAAGLASVDAAASGDVCDNLPIHVVEAITAATSAGQQAEAGSMQQAAGTEAIIFPDISERIVQLQARLDAEQNKADALRAQMQQVPRAERVTLPLSIIEAAGPAQHIALPIIAPDGPREAAAEGMSAVLEDKQQRIKELEALLAAKAVEENRIKAELEAIAPVRLNFNIVAADKVAGSTGEGVSCVTSSASFNDNADTLAKDRAEADMAWAEHLKSSDVPSLLRARAELEARCLVLQSQLQKLQGTLEAADDEKGLMEESIDHVIKSGDVGVLATLRERLRSGTSRFNPTRRLFKHKPAVPRMAGRTEAQAPLQDSKVAQTALHRRRPVLGSRRQEGQGEAAGDGGPEAQPEYDAKAAAGDAYSETSLKLLDDAETELLSLRDENQMLMEHLVTSKVRLAEVEGDFLETRRALLRAREKQVQMAKQLTEQQQSATEEAETTAGKPPATVDEQRALQIPGLT